MGILIRPAGIDDQEAIREIAIAAYWKTFGPHNTKENMDAYLHEAYNLAQLHSEFGEPTARLFLACDGKEACGFVRTRITGEVENLLGKNTIELQRLYIHPRHQGKKAGSALMEHTLAHAVDVNYEWIWLGVWERNFKAQKFYLHWGFEQFSAHVFQMGDDPQTDLLFRKRLRV